MKREQPTYTHTDELGVRWRWVVGKPVSELADVVLSEVGLEWDEAGKLAKRPKEENDDQPKHD